MRHLRSLIIRIVIIVILQKCSRLHIIGLRGLTDLNLRPLLTNHTYFIWYLPFEGDDNNVEIFDRLNAGKIGLNNAELVKALLLQSSNIPTLENYASQINMSDRDVIQKIALEWDNIERKLHDDSLWGGFIYSEAKSKALNTKVELNIF